jgi:signal transduction histidine kinase
MLMNTNKKPVVKPKPVKTKPKGSITKVAHSKPGIPLDRRENRLVKGVLQETRENKKNLRGTAKTSKEKFAAKFAIANKELAYQNEEKTKRVAELVESNKELAYQNEEKAKRAAELITANKELAYQNEEKAKRAAELIIANKELAYQNAEKAMRAAELVKANKELAFNITKLKKAEEELIKYRAHLEEMVNTRTEELHNAMDDLARSNTELERFAYVASHDLQEPLRMVTSFLQLLERRYKDKLDSDALEFINYAVDGSTRMKTLINDMLTYSRLGTRGEEFAITDCENILERVLSILQVSIIENQALVTHDPLPKVIGDDTQLEMLFQNLIGNAIKFHSKNPPKVHVGVKKNEKNWIFSVSDNGIGIDPQFFERIFIIFQRLHNREEYPGTGIGLAISKRIVERHGGRIWIESQPEKGSTFFFSLQIIGGSK